jgi:hypothetical protein
MIYMSPPWYDHPKQSLWNFLERSSLSHVTLQTLGEWQLGRKKCKTDRHDTMSIYNQDEKCLQRGTDWGFK